MLTSIDVYETLKVMKLSAWARKMGISYRRAWQMFRDGKLPHARQLPTGTIVVLEDEEEKKPFASGVVAIDARVSSHENRINLERQAERLKEYALAKGYQIKHLVKEVGSGVNDTRPRLITLFKKQR